MPLREALSPSSSGETPGRGWSVLVVEDSPLQRRLLGDHLRSLGFVVRLEPAAPDALASLSEARPDAILCDIVLPGVDGFALCRAIKADPALDAVPVVLVTSTDVDESDRLLASRAGAAALVARRPGYDAVVEALVGVLDEAPTGGETDAGATLADLRDRFLAEGREEVDRLLDRVAPDADWADLSRAAHRWIGRGGTLGYPGIGERARELEAAAAEHEPGTARRVLESLARMFAGALAAHAEADGERAPEPRPPGSGPRAPVALDGPREVVLADDDEAVLAIVRTTLRNHGWRCHLARNGVEALALVRRIRPAAVIVDVNMPGRDGFEVLAELRAGAATRNVPVLLLTARHQEVDVLRGFDLGAADYVVKPFNPLELSARLNRLVHSSE
ncbi:MAG: response regulator [Gemmatimonadetes bacterium]|nr:response regulator [Gemmatimonadota bacterium]